MNPFQAAAAASLRALQAVAGISVTLSRGNLSATLTVVPGRSELDASPDGQVVHQARSIDLIVRASDYALAGEAVLPKQADRLTATDGSAVWEVVTPPYTPSDHLGHRLRVHCKKVHG